MAKISCHYFTQQCFLPADYLINNISKLADIPAIILQGRFDMMCQMAVADALVQAWANAELQILPNAGHSAFDEQVIDGFCQASNSMAKFLNELNE